MNKFGDMVSMVLVGILALGIAIYAAMMLFYVFGNKRVAGLLEPKPAYTFGLPICAIVAFAVVAVLNLGTADVDAAKSATNVTGQDAVQPTTAEKPPEKADNGTSKRSGGRQSADQPVGRLAFDAFGLRFSGPAGPVTLWVVVYLALVVSMRLVAASSGRDTSAARKLGKDAGAAAHNTGNKTVT